MCACVPNNGQSQPESLRLTMPAQMDRHKVRVRSVLRRDVPEAKYVIGQSSGYLHRYTVVIFLFQKTDAGLDEFHLERPCEVLNFLNERLALSLLSAKQAHDRFPRKRGPAFAAFVQRSVNGLSSRLFAFMGHA